MKCTLKILIAVILVLAVVILISVIRHYQLRNAVNDYIAQLKAKGEPMELAQVIPPPVPPERNGAPSFLKAAALLGTNDDVLSTNLPTAMLGVAPGKAAVRWMQPEIRGAGAINSWRDIQQSLKQDNEALNQLANLTNFPRFDFDLQYVKRFDMRLTHLSLERTTAQILATQAIYNLHSRHTDSAAADIRAIFLLVNGTHDERTAISQLVRIAIARIGIGATWELLQFPNLTDKELADLQAVLAQMEFIQAEESALPVEREGGITTLAKWRTSSSEFDKYFAEMKQIRQAMGNSRNDDSLWGKMRFEAKEFMWRYWWSYSDELRSLKGYQVLMDMMRLVETNGSFQGPLSEQTEALDKLGISKLNSSLDALVSDETDFHSMLSESIVTLGNVTRKVMEVEVAENVAVAAIALKRYQLKHGNHPPDLNALVPEFVSKVPLDPVDGQPLRYRRNADGTFLLYSVGENGKDDGGNPALQQGGESSNYYWQNPEALDWVWPQPATEAEIQNYYARPPK